MTDRPGPATLGNAAYLRKLRAEARERGDCTECRWRPAQPGRRMCTTCVARHKSMERTNVADGLCACGRTPKPGRKHCDQCLAAAGRRTKQKMAQRRADGVCALCPTVLASDPLATSRLCRPCADREAERAKRFYRGRS